MDGLRKTAFTDRLAQATKDRQAQLARALAKSPANDPDFAKRQAERADVKASREARAVQRQAAKLAEAEARLAKKLADDAAKIEAAQAAEAAHKEALRAAAERTEALAIEQKAVRDARYASRKSRQK